MWWWTIDRSLRYQHGRGIALLIVRVRTNRVVDLEPALRGLRRGVANHFNRSKSDTTT
jgi:hypothetical protein